MISKIAFTPAIVPVETSQAPINFKGTVETEETQKDNSGLLIGSLTALGAFGLGMLARKPKVVEKTVEKATKTAEEVAKKLTPQEQEKIWKEATKNNKYMYIAEQTSKGTEKVSKDLINASNPQMRPEVNPELVKLKNDMQARYALADAEKINTPAYVNEEIIKQSNSHMRFDVPTEQEHTAKELELLEAFNPTAYKHRMINTINHNNAIERAEKNSIANNVSENSKKALRKAKRHATLNDECKQDLLQGVYTHRNGNKYVVENGEIVKILDTTTQKGKTIEITDKTKIAKHLAKRNISAINLEFDTVQSQVAPNITQKAVA